MEIHTWTLALSLALWLLTSARAQVNEQPVINLNRRQQYKQQQTIESQKSHSNSPFSTESRGSLAQDSLPSSPSSSLSTHSPKRAPAVKEGDELQTLAYKSRRRGQNSRHQMPAAASSNPTTPSFNNPYDLFMTIQRQQQQLQQQQQQPRQQLLSTSTEEFNGNPTKPNIVVVLCDDLDVELGEHTSYRKYTELIPLNAVEEATCLIGSICNAAI